MDILLFILFVLVVISVPFAIGSTFFNNVHRVFGVNQTIKKARYDKEKEFDYLLELSQEYEKSLKQAVTLDEKLSLHENYLVKLQKSRFDHDDFFDINEITQRIQKEQSLINANKAKQKQTEEELKRKQEARLQIKIENARKRGKL